MRREAKPAVQSTGVSLDHPGTAYQAVDMAPGLKFFECGPVSATLSTKGCASRYVAAQRTGSKENEELSGCRRCVIGSYHAGMPKNLTSKIFGSSICPSCRRSSTRMISKRLCVSCYNRRREMASGKNARGTAPIGLLSTRPLHTVSVRMVRDGWARLTRFDGVGDLMEPVVQALRTSSGPVAFTFAARYLPRQPGLFD